jgi:FemAB-related protein (PEP-CTERM system-associated)
MIRLMTASAQPALTVWVHSSARIGERLPELTAFAMQGAAVPLSRHPAWLNVLRDGLEQEVFALEARMHGETCGFLPLAFIDSLLFGRYLVSLPYLNSNGVIAESPDVQALLVGRALDLADELDVNHLELRHERPIEHAALDGELSSKVHMRMELPDTPEALWKGFDPKVRNQIRKGEKNGFRITWGGAESLEAFYAVLSHNMRDLGTPVYGRRLFRAILHTFPDDAEIAVAWSGDIPVAAALLLHGTGWTEVPTASSLREYNNTCVNMMMYHKLLNRTIARGHKIFDFGRSTAGGPTFKFKKQWGARPSPATWQYALRNGASDAMRPDNPRYDRMIRFWRKLPVRLTQYIGPSIVRGIP